MRRYAIALAVCVGVMLAVCILLVMAQFGVWR